MLIVNLVHVWFALPAKTRTKIHANSCKSAVAIFNQFLEIPLTFLIESV